MSKLNWTLLKASLSKALILPLEEWMCYQVLRAHTDRWEEKKLRLQIPVEPEFANAQPDFTGSFFHLALILPLEEWMCYQVLFAHARSLVRKKAVSKRLLEFSEMSIVLLLSFLVWGSHAQRCVDRQFTISLAKTRSHETQCMASLRSPIFYCP
ncbi:MAG TPA: hypothetical protein V6D30_00320 [Leptolyngbyaceae cyanobacterium]